MSNTAYPPQRPLSVGEVLDLAFRIYRATLAKCLLFAAAGVIAGQLPKIYALVKGQPVVDLQSLLAQMRQPTYLLLYLIGTLLTVVFYAAVLLRQRSIITTGGVGGELSAALRRLPALLVLGILVGLSCGACFLPIWVVSSPAARALLVLIGLIAASYVIVSLLCAQTILLADGSGALASYTRSWRLASGSFWRLSLIYTVAVIVLFTLYLVVAALVGVVAGILGRGDVALVTASGAVLLVAIAALATPFYTALALAVLGDLTVRKEGVDLEKRISATA